MLQEFLTKLLYVQTADVQISFAAFTISIDQIT